LLLRDINWLDSASLVSNTLSNQQPLVHASCLHLASDLGKPNIVTFLLESGASYLLNSVSSVEGSTPIQLAEAGLLSSSGPNLLRKERESQGEWQSVHTESTGTSASFTSSSCYNDDDSEVTTTRASRISCHLMPFVHILESYLYHVTRRMMKMRMTMRMRLNVLIVNAVVINEIQMIPLVTTMMMMFIMRRRILQAIPPPPRLDLLAFKRTKVSQ
jgi:hypothetical protein